MQTRTIACCAAASTPEVYKVGDPSRPPSSATQATAKLLDGPGLMQSSPFRDLRSQLTDLRHRQEDLFRQLMDRQNALQNQMLEIHSTSHAIEKRQEELIGHFSESTSKPWKADVVKDVDLAGKCEQVENQEKRISVGTESSSLFDSAAVAPIVEPPNKSANGTSSPSARKKSKAALTFRMAQSLSEGVDKSLRHRVEKLLKRQEFEFSIALVILVNAFVVCFESQYLGLDVGYNLQFPGRDVQAHVVWEGAETAFTFFDWLFGMLFLLELVVKLAVWKFRYFWDSEDWDMRDEDERTCKHPCWRCLASTQIWNMLDFLCVLAFLVDKVVTITVSVNPFMLRMLRLFRLMRLVRLLRLMETLDHLYIMTTAISSLSKVLTWAIVLLIIMLMTCDLFLVQILQATYFEKVIASDLSEDQLLKHHKMYEYFGTCTRCMLSMFEITLGNWPPVARLLSEEVSEWFTLFCLLHKLTIGFAVIGVITGVILQETFKVAQTDDVIMFRNKKLASSTLRKKMKTLFEALDAQGDGRLEEAEFSTIGDFPEIKFWLASLDIETDDLKTLFSLIDVEGNGYITLDELVARMPRIKGNARSIDMLAMRQSLRK